MSAVSQIVAEINARIERGCISDSDIAEMAPQVIRRQITISELGKVGNKLRRQKKMSVSVNLPPKISIALSR